MVHRNTLRTSENHVLLLQETVHQEHVPVLLLAGDGKQLCQPPHLLLDE